MRGVQSGRLPVGVLCCLAAMLLLAFSGAARVEAAGRLNVLFIAVDDLRPDLGCYGVDWVKSPHIDRLAAGGTVFNRAYCQQAVCSPSRTSLLTGRRPDTTRIYDLSTHFRAHLPDVVTLPQYFKQNGYHTQSIGKVYHGGLDDPLSWSAPSIKAQGKWYCDPKIVARLQAERKKIKNPRRQIVKRDPKTGVVLHIKRVGRRVNGPASEVADVDEHELPDGHTTDVAIELLRDYKKNPERPFFLAVGYLKPHLPFVAPKKYYDLYDPQQIGQPDNPYPPMDCPPIALTDWGELRAYWDIGRDAPTPLPPEKTLQLRHAYYACVSYVDAQIGRLLDALDQLGLADDTIVILWGDHGWQLGEHGLWCKHTNFELATRAPLIVRAPNQSHPGARTDALVEFVDIYPTLCELAGLPLPDGLEGTSMVPVMNDPDRPWKSAAFSQYPRAGGVMGYSMRTDRYRYTEWRKDGQVVARELYDHKYDPAENVNVVDRPQHRELVQSLSRQLQAGWQAARPRS